MTGIRTINVGPNRHDSCFRLLMTDENPFASIFYRIFRNTLPFCLLLAGLMGMNEGTLRRALHLSFTVLNRVNSRKAAALLCAGKSARVSREQSKMALVTIQAYSTMSNVQRTRLTSKTDLPRPVPRPINQLYNPMHTHAVLRHTLCGPCFSVSSSVAKPVC